MGYVHSLPYAYIRWGQRVTVQSSETITTGDNDYGIGSIKTPKFTQPLSHALVEFCVDARVNTSAVQNYLSSTNNHYITLDDTVNPVIDCGQLPNYACVTPSSSSRDTVRFLLDTDIASYLKSDTTYNLWFMSFTAAADSLILYNPRVELSLYFGMD